MVGVVVIEGMSIKGWMADADGKCPLGWCGAALFTLSRFTRS